MAKKTSQVVVVAIIALVVGFLIGKYAAVGKPLVKEPAMSH